MGQIKNIKLHIVTDIKMLTSQYIRGLSRLSRKASPPKGGVITNPPWKSQREAPPHTQKKKLTEVQTISKGSEEIVVSRKQTRTQTTHHRYDNTTTFTMLNLREDVINGLESDGVGQPTVVQTLGIPMIMEGKNVFCAAQTGSGKTYTYIAPLLNAIKDKSEEGYMGRLQRPKAVIVAPTRELAAQILRVVKAMGVHAPVRSLGVIGQNQRSWSRGYARGLVDVVVATPGLLLKYHARENIIFSDLMYLVLDEADTLMDENFKEATERIIELCRLNGSEHSAKQPPQCILTAATLPPDGILSSYEDLIPHLEMCRSKLHQILPNIQHRFVKTQQTKKLSLLLKELKSLKESDKCVVFCNTSHCCNWLSKELSARAVEHTALRSKVRPFQRLRDYTNFACHDSCVLVCSDVGARGLDTSSVSLVVNFDCPFNATDYIHRSGRVGRARDVNNTRSNEVVTFVTKNSEVDFALKIRSAVEKEKSIDHLIVPKTERDRKK